MTDIDVAAVLALAQAARRNDGVAPLSEAFLLDLRSPHPRSTHLTAQIDGELAGYGQVDPAGATELVVHPDHRHAGVARDLWKRALAAGATSLWAHGGLPASAGSVPEHHVVGVDVGQHVPDLMQGGGEPGLADHVRGALRALVGCDGCMEATTGHAGDIGAHGATVPAPPPTAGVAGNVQARTARHTG